MDRGSALSGIKVNGSYILGATSADTTVITVPSTFFRLFSQGNLFVTKDTTPVRPHQLLGGTRGETILRLNFRADVEPVDVTNLQITNSGSTASSVERLELFREGETSYFAIASTNSCGNDDVPQPGRTFCASMQSQQLVIPKGGEVKVLVRPRLKNDDAGAVSNQHIQLYLDESNAMNNSIGTGAVRARGADSANGLNSNDGDGAAEGEVFIGTSTAAPNRRITGNGHVTVLSKISSVTNANTDPNGSPVPTGVKEIGKFKISAAPNTNVKNGINKVTLSGVYFNVTAGNVLIAQDSLFLYNAANQNVAKACEAYATNGTRMEGDLTGMFLVLCDFRASTGNVMTQIDQGADATFTLRMEIVNPDIIAANSSNLLVSLQDFTSDQKHSFAYNDSHILWEDQDNGGSTTFTWVDFPETVVSSTSYQS